MFLSSRVLLGALFLFGCCHALPNAPLNKTFCDKSIALLETDCSFMLGASSGSCVIHHTNSCRTYQYDSWSMRPEQKVVTLQELDYRVSLSTYNHDKSLTLNVSLDTLSPDVRGLTFTLLEYTFPDELHRYNTCRIFDFRNFSSQITASLFYDCYYNIKGDHNNKFFQLTTHGLPTNRVGIFYVTLSTSPTKPGGETPCNWESTIMILKPALPLGNVIVQFSVADPSFNVSMYNVSLVKHIPPSGYQVEIHRFVNTDGQDGPMATVQFLEVRPASYYLEIHPIHHSWTKPNCSVTVTDTFVIHPVSHGEATITVAIACVLFVTLLISGMLAYIFVRRKKNRSTRTASVFLLYSYDSDSHFEVVKALYDFLSDVPGLDVVFDVAEANQMGVPHLWLSQNLRNVDYIMLVVSSGVYDKIEKQKRPPDEHHPWGDHIVPAVLDIVRDEELHRKLIKVIIKGTSETKVPTSLFSKGIPFKLPKQLHRCVHYIFNESCRTQLQCATKHPEWISPEREKSFVRTVERQAFIPSQ